MKNSYFGRATGGALHTPFGTRRGCKSRCLDTAPRRLDFTNGQFILHDMAKLWRTRIVRSLHIFRCEIGRRRPCVTLVSPVLPNRPLLEKTDADRAAAQHCSTHAEGRIAHSYRGIARAG